MWSSQLDIKIWSLPIIFPFELSKFVLLYWQWPDLKCGPSSSSSNCLINQLSHDNCPNVWRANLHSTRHLANVSVRRIGVSPEPIRSTTRWLGPELSLCSEVSLQLQLITHYLSLNLSLSLPLILHTLSLYLSLSHTHIGTISNVCTLSLSISPTVWLPSEALRRFQTHHFSYKLGS